MNKNIYAYSVYQIQWGTIKCLIIIKLVNSSHLRTRLQDLPSIHLRTVFSIFFVFCINSCSLTVRDHGANIGSILFLLWSPLTEAPLHSAASLLETLKNMHVMSQQMCVLELQVLKHLLLLDVDSSSKRTLFMFYKAQTLFHVKGKKARRCICHGLSQLTLQKRRSIKLN